MAPARRGLTLVETLVATAVAGVLVGLLLAAVHEARGVAFRTRDRSAGRQLGLAALSYAAVHGRLPPGMVTDPTATPVRTRYWFGSYDGTSPEPDVAGGFLMPHLEDNRGMFAGPARNRGKVYLTYGGATGGFGYNALYLTRDVYAVGVELAAVGTTSGTVLFANAAAATPGPGPDGRSPHLYETWVAHPPGIGLPSVHFRQAGRVANVVFVDGHAEGRTDRTRNPPRTVADPSGGPPLPAEDPALGLADLRDRESVYDLGATDDLWDRE